MEVELHKSELTASRSDRFNLFQGQDTEFFVVSEDGWTPETV